nr:natural cytotoxicity triggering receptor 1 isoform X1 [Camelus dromedarius]
MSSRGIMSIFHNLEADPEMSFRWGRKLSEILVRKHRYNRRCHGHHASVLTPDGQRWRETFESSREKGQCESPTLMMPGFTDHILCVSLAAGLGLHPAAPHQPSRTSAMPPALAALLFLGLFLSQRSSTQKRESSLQSRRVWVQTKGRPGATGGERRGSGLLGGLEASSWAGSGAAGASSGTPASDSLPETLSKPAIWAKPSFMVPKGQPVIIWCQGAHGAVEYQLYFEGGFSALERPKSLRMTNKVKFPIPAMTSNTAGIYRCFYRSGELWSEPSDPLDLVVTGMYDTPTLSVQPRPEVASGENVTFYCHLAAATNTFFLLKEGTPRRPQSRYGNIRAEFPVGPVSAAHRGTYRCFGSYNNHAWSFPSEPVELLVRGDVGDTSAARTEHTSSPDPWDSYPLTTETPFEKDLTLWDHTAQNLLRIGLAFLVLVAVVWLLAEDWLHRKKPQKRANRVSSRECRRRFRTQRPLEKQPRDVVAAADSLS